MRTELFLCAFVGAAAQSMVCMSGDPRCGTCVDDLNECDQATACEFSSYVQEFFDAGSADNCAAYVEASKSMSQDVTKDDLTDTENGVPAHAYGVTLAIYPDDTGFDKLNVTERSMRLKRNSLNRTAVPPCTKEALLTFAQYSDDFQDCFNKYIFNKGEDYLEQAACTYITDGAGAAFCDSRLWKGIKGMFNKVLNGAIEGPVVHVMDKVEDAAADACKSVFHAFSSFF